MILNKLISLRLRLLVLSLCVITATVAPLLIVCVDDAIGNNVSLQDSFGTFFGGSLELRIAFAVQIDLVCFSAISLIALVFGIRTSFRALYLSTTTFLFFYSGVAAWVIYVRYQGGAENLFWIFPWSELVV